ncbi:MAG: lamin tail domain-containing protein [Deltaproteobacteria bacterium]|nr:lamin tail domain-containing protein [Deltaproteobacteria bacterium]
MTRRSLALALALVLPACGDDDSTPGDVVDGADSPDETPAEAETGSDGDADLPDDASAEADGEDDGGGDAPLSPLFGRIVFNEVLIDGLAEGDPNGDGDVDAVEDQFVELVNVDAAPVVLDGCTLVELDLAALPRHTFAEFTLAAGNAVVVFGGGDAPEATATASFFSANAADPGIPFGLHLSAPADDLMLLDASGLLAARFCYGGTDGCPLAAAADESLTRSPERTGDFVPHTTVGADGAAFSPGTRADGTPF